MKGDVSGNIPGRIRKGIGESIRENVKQRVVFTICFCQFLSGLCTLGIAPFFSQILKNLPISPSLPNTPNPMLSWFDLIFSAGILYHLPNFCGALISPVWGRLSDRYGKKTLLLRAQLGLVLSFCLATFSTQRWHFVVALFLQGVLGGTFAASRAYLADVLGSQQLARSFTWIELSPRLAWFLGPCLFGWYPGRSMSPAFYGKLVFLPLLAVLLCLFLPQSESNPKTAFVKDSPKNFEPHGHLNGHHKVPSFFKLGLLQFFWGFSNGMVAPYFIQWILIKVPQVQWSGFIFGIPQLVYLLFFFLWVGRVGSKINESKWIKKRTFEFFCYSLIFQGVSLVGQGISGNILELIFWRVTFGIALTLSFVSFHELLSLLARRGKKERSNGQIFGRLDLISRLSGIGGGAFVGWVLYSPASSATFYIAAILLMSCSALVLFCNRKGKVLCLDNGISILC